MLTNEKRREILETARAVGYKGSILDLFNAARAGQDISQLLQPQNMEVAQTPEQQSQGLRPQHAAGNTNASMAFPNVPPNTPFSTEGMKAPINISKFDEQGHLVQSFKNVPPGIQSLPTGPGKGTVIETPAYKKGGYKAKYQLGGFGDTQMLDEVQVTAKSVNRPKVHTNPFGNFEGYVDVGEESFNTGEAENLFLPLNFSGTSFKGVGADNVQFKRPGLLANQATDAFRDQYGYVPKNFRSRALGALTSGFRGKSDYKPSFKDRLANAVYNKGYKSVYAPGYDYPLTPTSFSNTYYTNPGDSKFNLDYLDLGKGKLDSEFGREKIDMHDARDMFERTDPIWQHGLSIDIEPTYSGNIKKSRVSNIDTDSKMFNVATPFTSNLLDYVGSDTYFERLAAGQYADEIDVDRFSTDPQYRSSFANRLVQEKPEFIKNQYQSLTDQFKDGVGIRDVRTQGGDLTSWASSGTSPGEGGTNLHINPDLFTKGKTREEVERDVTKTLRHRNVATYEPEFNMSGRMQPDEFDKELKNPYSAVSQARDMLVNAGMDTQNFDWRNTIGHELGHSISMSRLKSLSRDNLNFDNNDPNAYSNDYKFLYGLNNLTSGGNFYSLQDHLDSGETSKTYLQTLDEKLEGQASELDSKYHLVSPEETVGDIHGVRAYNQRVYGINPKEPFTKEQLETLLKDDEFKKSLIYDRMNQRFGEDQSKWMKAMNLIASTEGNTSRATYAQKGGYRSKYQTGSFKDRLFPPKVQQMHNNLEPAIYDGMLDEVVVTPYTSSGYAFGERMSNKATGALKPGYPVFEAMTLGLKPAATAATKSIRAGIKNAPAKINPRYFKPSEDLWYRQVGKSAIDDIAESKVIREGGEDILNSQKVYNDRVLRMKGIDPDTGKPFANYETAAAEQLLGSRRPKSPYFQKGELYWGWNRKPGKGKPGRGGDADSEYLIESLLGDDAFHPAHVKGMFPDTPNKLVGDIGILKPRPELRNPENFNLYERSWWSGYKPIKKQKGGYRSKYQTAGIREQAKDFPKTDLVSKYFINPAYAVALREAERADENAGSPSSRTGKMDDFTAGAINTFLYNDPTTFAAKQEGLQKLRDYTFENVRPVAYPSVPTYITSIGNAIGGKLGITKGNAPPKRDAEGDYTIDEEMYAKVMNVPHKSKYISESKYKPSKAKDSDAKYYTLDWDEMIDKEKLIDYAAENKLMKGENMVVNSLAPFLKEGYMPKEEFKNIDPLENFTIGLGEDDKGRYLSIYDKYDFNKTFNTVTSPFEIYDRFHLYRSGGYRNKYQFGGRQGDTFQEVDTYIKPGQSTRPNWAQTPDAVTNYTFGKNLVDDESRFSLGLQGTDILDEIKYRGDLIANAGIGIGNRKGKSFRPAGENLRAGVRGQASWQGVPGNVLENMFPRSGVDVRGSFEGEAGLAYGNGAVSPYMSVTPQTNFSLNDNLSLGVGYEMRGRYDKNRNNPIYGSTSTGTVAPLSQRDAYSGMGRGAGRLSLKYDMGDGDFIEGYYSKPNSLYQGSMYPAPGVIALENEGPRFGVRLKKSF